MKSKRQSWIGCIYLGVNIIQIELKKKRKKLNITVNKSPNYTSFMSWALRFQLWLKIPGEHELSETDTNQNGSICFSSSSLVSSVDQQSHSMTLGFFLASNTDASGSCCESWFINICKSAFRSFVKRHYREAEGYY